MGGSGMASAATGSTDDKRRLIKLIRQGKIVGGDNSASNWLKDLLKAGVTGEDLDYNEKPYHRSAIWEATWKAPSISACEALIKELVNAGANIAHADYQGRTPLHEAAYYGHLELVKYMVEK